MDKNYNVDDILSEIKSRKSREKAVSGPERRASELPEETAPPQPDFDFRPDRASREEAPAPPREPLEEAPRTVAREPGKTAPRPARLPREELPRTVREAGEAPVRPVIEPREETPQPVRRPRATPPEDSGIGEFRFDTVPEPRKRRPNPLDFTGQAQSLTDKAAQRPRQPAAPSDEQKIGFSRPPQGKPVPERPKDIYRIPSQIPEDPYEPPQPPQEPLQTAPPRQERPRKPVPGGFDAFRPLEGDEADVGHTRILPTIPQEEGLDYDINPEAEQRVPGVGFRSGRPRIRVDENDYDEDGEYQDDVPEHSAIDFSEYNSRSDRRDVAMDIAKVKLWLFIRTGVTLVLTFVLFWFVLSGRYADMPMLKGFFPEPETMRKFLILCTGLTALLALVNSSSIGGGLISLFKMRANSDTLAALAVLGAIAQGVVGVVKPDSIDATALSLYFPMAALSMLFGCLGKMTMINRIQTNFRIIASDRKKQALLRVEDAEFCREFVPDATRKPTIAYAVPSDFFTDFLALSYSDKYDVGINRAVAPVCLMGSVVVGVICFLLTESTVSAVSAFAAILCISATFSATFIENIPLGKLTKKLAPMGGMVSGNKAVEDFCDTAAIILTETDLFPEGNVRLRGIWTFSQGRIDESIVDAASVLCALNGALSPVFLQMLGGDKKLLKKADNIVYENSMGVSAWVDSRRVLIGNRLLMQNHGISIPPESQRITQSKAPEDGEMLYLSSSGEITAQFMVSYHIDDELAAQLDILAAKDKKLIIHASDANITPHRVWELYGYPEDLIEILPAERHQQYRRMIAHRESAIAEIVYTGRATAMAAALIACMNARSSILSATMVQLIQIVLGYGLIAFMAFMGAVGSLTILQMTIYQMFWFVVIYLVQKFKAA